MQTLAKQTLLVAAGKGGVGKSTLAVNLAVALAERGVRVGLLDADLYGPSIPLMLGLRRLSPRTLADGTIIPFTKFGVHTLSIGFFLEESRSILWRGPMLDQMLKKMVLQVAWPPLDVLLVDLPPGTGDVPLSLAKLLTITGALMITTPQEVAIADVIKAIHAFDQLEIPLLALVENFSGYKTADGTTHYPFGHGKGVELARNLNIPCLDTIPLIEAIREGSDAGIPHPKPYAQVADKLLDRLE